MALNVRAGFSLPAGRGGGVGVGVLGVGRAVVGATRGGLLLLVPFTEAWACCLVICSQACLCLGTGSPVSGAGRPGTLGWERREREEGRSQTPRVLGCQTPGKSEILKSLEEKSTCHSL